MINFTIDSLFFYILIFHYLADFVLQTHDQAVNKGEGHMIWNKYLFNHVGTYSLIWLFGFYIIFNNWIISLMLSIINFILHYIIDWITSRIGKPYWKNNDYHNGFAIVGFDQILHYTCLWYLIKLGIYLYTYLF